jgi:cation diffusion facilitator family transporter
VTARRSHTPISSTTSVWAALIGDVLVVASKAVAAALTGSAAMFSEAIHSFVDTVNEILLLYGIHRSRIGADADHPFGHGRELYFWSFVVSLLIFELGAGASIWEGVRHIRHPVAIDTPWVSYLVLALAFVFEGSSWVVSLRQFSKAKGRTGFFKAFHLSKDPPAFMTLFEDSVALLGILVAAVGTFVATTLHHPMADGIASIAIGVMLGVASIYLARESKSLLIGEQAHPHVRRSIMAIANSRPRILRANGVITAQLGPNQIVAMLSVEFADSMTAPQIEKEVERLESLVCDANLQVIALFVKPQTRATFREHHVWHTRHGAE